jgi:1,4-dihydroxy-2-naphthoate octaprenyltransferase
VTHQQGKANFVAGFWRLADPKISLASMVSIFIGTCAATASGSIDFVWLAVTVIGIFAIEVAKNASGEIFDFDSGADLEIAPEDRSPFSGGKRVLVDGLLTRKQTICIAAVSYLTGAALGFAIVLWKQPSVFWFGFAGIICAFFYQAPPLKFSYRGFGELAVAISYGPLICCGTYLVQRGKVDIEPVLLSIPLGLLIATFLWVDEFPDCPSDAKAGKRTVVVRLGRKRASRVFPVIFAIAFGMLLVLPFFGLPKQVLLGGVAIIPAVAAALRVWKNPEKTAKIIPAQKQTLLAFVLYALGTGAGFLLS